MALVLDPKLDFQPFGNSRSGFGSSKNWNHNTSKKYLGRIRLCERENGLLLICKRKVERNYVTM